MAFGEVYVPAIVGDAYDKTQASINLEVNPLLEGKTLAGDGQLYSSHTPGVSYVRNTGFWGAQYDISCVSVWNSVSATTRRLTLVTPRHAIGADHYGGYAIGQTYGFLDMDNNYYTRTIDALVGEDVSDIIVVQFDSDLPASVVPCKIFPENWASFLDLGTFSTRIYPALATNQYNEGTIQQFHQVFADSARFETPTPASWLSMYKLPITGDSGNPSFLMQNGNTFLLTHWYNDDYGPLYASYITYVNSTIAGFGSGYTLTSGVLTSDDIDALGNPLTSLGGYVHNRCEVDAIQTDPDETIFGGANIYGDTVTWASLGITDWDAHVNGDQNVWVQWEKTGANNVCHVKEVIAYDVTLSLTPTQYSQALNWAQKYTDECGNGVVAASKAIALAGGELIQLAGGEQIELS